MKISWFFYGLLLEDFLSSGSATCQIILTRKRHKNAKIGIPLKIYVLL